MCNDCCRVTAAFIQNYFQGNFLTADGDRLSLKISSYPPSYLVRASPQSTPSIGLLATFVDFQGAVRGGRGRAGVPRATAHLLHGEGVEELLLAPVTLQGR